MANLGRRKDDCDERVGFNLACDAFQPLKETRLLTLELLRIAEGYLAFAGPSRASSRYRIPERIEISTENFGTVWANNFKVKVPEFTLGVYLGAVELKSFHRYILNGLLLAEIDPNELYTI